MFSPTEPPTAVGPATVSKANGFASPLATSLTVAAFDIRAAGACQGPGTNCATLAIGVTTFFKNLPTFFMKPNCGCPVTAFKLGNPPTVASSIGTPYC